MLGLQMAESSSCAAVPQAKALTTAGRQRVPTTGDGEKNGKKALMHGSQLTDIDGSDTNIPPSVLRGCDDHLTECGQPGSPGAGQNIRSHPSKSNPVDPAAVNLEPLCSANEEEFEREWVHFTANPRPDDCVQYAVVTCAPMSALESYKYKTELFYGNAKKGQVADSLVAYFGAKASAANNETEAKAICSLEKNEIIEQLRANLKQVSLKQR
ncbi:unnamed protein product [Trypanosoma congolense IL3000]|uniref:WGS project CAEQ00000000 data, annotated contig 211 n=1 Tax=Trypanosoma congolense (strain IL3000) TaxID=1068625 RepID=F9WBJ2_TRYCI|nr:unnamed protein product [Trypanosoma congolense IL3000]